MAKEIRLKLEVVDTKTDKTVEAKEIKRHALKAPTGPHDFGLNQQEQFDLLKNTQDEILALQKDFLKSTTK